MGAVYEATQLSLDRVVALKVLAQHLSDDPSFITRFQREGKIQAGIDHPHIVTVFDSGKTDRGFFIAMRLVRGPNLKDLIVARELDAGRSLRILTPAAGALDAAHQAGLIHRDIKPQNILVGGRDQAYLADFGLTKASGDSGLTKTGQFVGTLDYISPSRSGRAGHEGERRLRPRRRALRVPERRGALSQGLRGGGALRAHGRSAAAPERAPSGHAGLDRAGAHQGDGQGRERTLPQRRRADARGQQGLQPPDPRGLTPPGPIEAPQETGIRPAEGDVATREGQTPDVTRVGPEQAQTAAAAEAAPEVTRAGAPPPPETVAPPPETVAPPPETQAPPPETVAPPPETQAPPPETVAPQVPSETRMAPSETAPARRRTRPGSGNRARRGRRRPRRRWAPRRRSPRPAPRHPRAAQRSLVGRHGHPRRPAGTAGRRRSAAPVFAGLGIAALVAIVVGFLIGSSGGDSSEPAGNETLAAGAVDISPPSDWTRSAGPAQIPGIDFGDDGTTVTPSGGAEKGTLTVGVTDATDSTLLPDSFLKELSSKPKPTDGVRLGDLEAFRYKGLKPKGFSQQLTVYAAPTTEGVATIACAAPAAEASAFLAECEKVSTTIKMKAGKAYPLGTDDDYASDLSDTINSLNSARDSGVKKMKSAKSGSSQASAANSVAAAYASAASTLKDADVSPQFAGDNSDLVKALSSAESAYKSLGAPPRRTAPRAITARARRSRAPSPTSPRRSTASRRPPSARPGRRAPLRRRDRRARRRSARRGRRISRRPPPPPPPRSPSRARPSGPRPGSDRRGPGSPRAPAAAPPRRRRSSRSTRGCPCARGRPCPERART